MSFLRRSRHPARLLLSLTLAFAPIGVHAQTSSTVPAGWVAHPPVIVNHLGITPASPYSNSFTPAEMRSAYGLTSLNLPNTTGQGVTVAIVDAYGDIDSNLNDFIQTDLQTFSTTYGLPYSDASTASPTVTEVYPDGQATAGDTGIGNWPIETALDVEWVHSVAPDAKILLVISPNAGGGLFDGVTYAAQHAPIVSMSWGGPEYNGETSSDLTFTAPNVAFFAASGDWGGPWALYPSSSPNVTAVGGTTLYVDQQSNWSSEIGWYDSGGGVSDYEAHPPFQNTWFSTGNRRVPDIAALADPYPGVNVVQNGQVIAVGGTSLSSPLWAGFTAVLDGNLPQPIGEAALHNMLYRYGSPADQKTYFHDVDTGYNYSYFATPGYDFLTGIGSPKLDTLLPAIVNTPASAAPVISSPTSASGNIVAPFDYQIVASNGPTSFSATGLPSGLTINPVTGSITGTPSAPGMTDAMITAANAAGSAGEQLTITVGGQLPRPVVPAGLSVTTTAHTLFAYRIPATNSPSSYTVSGLPSYLHFNSDVGLIEGWITAPGKWTANVTATNTSGTGAGQLTIIVNPAAPVIVGASTAAAFVGVPFQYQITALQNPSAFGPSTIGDGLTLNQTTGVISGTPVSPGVIDVQLTASNVSGTAVANFEIDVASTVPSPIVVTNTSDTGQGSLRDAITAADAAPGSTITFASGLAGTITLATNLPAITCDTTITGPGAANLAVSGGAQYRVLRIGNGNYLWGQGSSGPGGSATVSGLTIEGGTDKNDLNGGGGILVTSTGALTLTNCDIVNNSVDASEGGGLENAGVSNIVNCTFSQDSVVGGGHAGGALANIGLLALNNCLFSNNVAYNGTVIFNDGWSRYNVIDLAASNYDSSISATDCTFRTNSYPDSGSPGSVVDDFGITEMTGCTFSGNTTNFGSIVDTGNNATYTACTFSTNNMTSTGVAPSVATGQGTNTFANCTIMGNQGGYSVMNTLVDYELPLNTTYSGGFLNLLDCTVYDNASTGSGEAINTASSINIAGSILYDNQFANVDSEIQIDPTPGFPTPFVSVQHSDIFGGYTGTGNIDADPLLSLLANNGGPTTTMALLSGSPCLGTGVAIPGITTDERGIPRPQGGRYDVGAYERQDVPPPAPTGLTATEKQN